MQLGLGLGLTARGNKGAGVSGPSITLSASTIAEDADSGATVGTFSVVNGSGSYTFTLTDTAGNRFAVDGADLERGATALDFETDPSHSITVEADNGVDDPISRVLTITVTDVEPEVVGDFRLLADGISFRLQANGTDRRYLAGSPF